VERVGAVGERLFELTVDAEPSEDGGEVAGGPGGPELAGRAEFDGGLLGDQQVRVCRVFSELSELAGQLPLHTHLFLKPWLV
jgi:hypothetical protein